MDLRPQLARLALAGTIETCGAVFALIVAQLILIGEVSPCPTPRGACELQGEEHAKYVKPDADIPAELMCFLRVPATLVRRKHVAGELRRRRLFRDEKRRAPSAVLATTRVIMRPWRKSHGADTEITPEPQARDALVSPRVPSSRSASKI